jgi:FkbM family methyltransferase
VELLHLNEKINVADIGASAIAETPVYKELIEKGLGHLFAFDGDERHITKLQNLYGSNATILNDFLGDGEEHTAYVCHENSGMTSLLKPSKQALGFFNGFTSFGEVLKQEQVATKTLNEVSEIDHLHFIKMDIQGSELSVLENGMKKLSDCVAIQLEISFICLYENQPTFGDTDVWMRKHGFAPHCFLDIKRWSIAPTVQQNNFRIPFNQLLEADIVYIKDPLDMPSWTPSQLKMMAVIADNFFASTDLAVHCLKELVRKGEIGQEQIGGYLSLQ